MQFCARSFVDQVEQELLHARITRLAWPEKCFLAQLDVFLRIERNAHQPLIVAHSLLLRQREQNLLPEILVLQPRIQVAQKLRVLGRTALTEPENRLLAQIRRFALSHREVAQNLLRPRLALLREREQSLLLDVLVTVALQNLLEQSGRAWHLRQPEHGLLA